MSIESLVESIRHCTCCNLHVNGKHVPHVSEHSKYILLLDHLKLNNEDCLDKLWKLFKEMHLSLEEFVVMHTTQCRTKTTRRIGKMYTPAPSRSHREECKPWLHAMLQELNPPKMLVMGNIAMEHVGCGFNGIKEKNGTVETPKICGIAIPCVLSVSPSYLKEWGKGEAMIKKSLGVFKNL